MNPASFSHGVSFSRCIFKTSPLCVDMEPLVADIEKETGERFEVVQVKEKLGTLRFYVSHHSDAINERIAEAGKEASHTCEVCG